MFLQLANLPQNKSHIRLIFKTFFALLFSLLVCIFSKSILAETIYYVSSSFGDDKNDGVSKETAWSSLEKVNASTFEAGDKILFKSGDEFFGSLIINSSGQPGSPISFSSYGDQDLPIIDAATKSKGKNMAAVLIQIKIILKSVI